MADWKDTLNLPKTAFPMKANLQTTEPQMLAHWEATDLYRKLRDRRRGAPVFILHDGPPYANGDIHLGTALNKVLKDIVVRSRSMMGFDSPYVPGWDCHGLPIELKLLKELGSKKTRMSVADLRRACREYAMRYMNVQRAQFKRLGVLGDWDDPYLTMDYRYQAAIVRALGKFVGQGMVYKGKKPVHWCIHCRTALAEAEVEYDTHTSPSIYVEFPLGEASQADLSARVPELAGRAVSALIWTTTPWTIPSNLALAFHPEARYGAYPVDGRVVVVAEALAEGLAKDLDRAFGEPIVTVSGAVFEGLKFRHPLYARDSVGVLADYVTLDTGTGVVHTAPGHGSDDFRTGVRYGLEIYAPVGGDGRFLDTVERFAGLTVFEANPKVEDALADAGRLWKKQQFEHSYPHCWRCHNPVIFLATSQWFIGMDDTGLRARATAEAERVEWFPAWGGDRMRGMFETRPDWCISRQRSWGVPIPAITCTSCGTATLTTELVERAAQAFEKDGAEAWYERPLADFVPDGFACPSCGGTGFEREKDILDVWFDSGSSHEAVLAVHPELRWPADLYLEGTDQYRGWFQSSMLVGLGTRGRAPFNQVVTHGFVVTEDGKKMSKSLGNDVPPEQIITQSGAEILRLWVASVDYREEVRFGPEILARVVEAYRKLRNTLRILVANLADFNPATDMVPPLVMDEVDRFAMARYGDLAARVRAAYEQYDFPAVFQAVNAFVTVDISAFYVDVSKDRVYTLAAGDRARRSAQTAMFAIADGLARLIAPVLPVLAEEFWTHLPGEREESVHLAEFPTLVHLFQNDELVARWSRLLKLRAAVNAELEKLRQSKTIGQSLEAVVHLRGTGAMADLLAASWSQLPALFITSQVDDRTDPPGAGTDPVEGSVFVESEGSAVHIVTARAGGAKCDRCWRYVPAVSAAAGREGVCPRCDNALAGAR
ncbi:MAG: isoleucine--tRNA ligase [Acidobacteria bacterium]|nr:isoleucine--tRNA ligase [Acidobacteriota bacterium]